LPEEKIMEEIERFVNKNIRYDADKILGFPGTNPEPLSTRVYSEYLRHHSNNIGMHTNKEGGRESEAGFPGTQEAECQVIAMAADLMNGVADQIDGYISSGGTEANIVGCWIGRNCYQGTGTGTAIIGSFLTHYSITKAADILGIGTKPREDGGLHTLGTDTYGRVLIDQLEKKVLLLAGRGVSNIIVVGNAGTTMLGSIDDIPKMDRVIGKLKETFPKVNIHFHVDAAMGGFIAPFIPSAPSVGFSNRHVDSITIDVHKMGLAPYGSGIILARRGLFERIKSIAPYVPGNDCTLCGSRAGAMALSCWAAMKKIGKNGYADNAKKLMSLVRYAQNGFKILGIETFSSDINIIAVKGYFPDSLGEKFITHAHRNFPANLSDPSCGQRTGVWNVVVMNHTTKDLMDELFSDLRFLRKEGIAN